MSKVYAYKPEDLRKVKISLEEITPEIAKDWLAKYNTNNYRPFKPRKIDQYARDMAAGHWRLTTETVKFDWNNILADGQNRLAAIIKANVTLTLVIARGLDPVATDVMDTGGARRAADVLRRHGGQETQAVAAAARIALWANKGGTHMWRDTFTHAEILDWVEEHDDIYNAVSILGTYGRKAPLRPSVRIYLAWRFAQEDAFASAEFFHRFGSGENLNSGNPILALRNRLTGLYGSTRRMTVEDQLNITIRAWNAWIKGRSLERVVDTTRSSVAGKLVDVLGPDKPWEESDTTLGEPRAVTESVEEWLAEHGEEPVVDFAAVDELAKERTKGLLDICTCPNYPKAKDFECPQHSMLAG